MESRQRRLNVRLSQQEWERISKRASGTTCRSVSEYARNVLLRKPVRVFYRNQSYDHFESQMNRLLPILEGAGRQFGELIDKFPTHQAALEGHILDVKLYRVEFQLICQEIKTLIAELVDHETKNNDVQEHR